MFSVLCAVCCVESWVLSVCKKSHLLHLKLITAKAFIKERSGSNSVTHLYFFFLFEW